MKKIRIYLELPQIWLAIIILALAGTAFIVSKNMVDAYWQSLLSNTVAGLLTGFVISLLSGCRQGYISTQERKLRWMQELRKEISEYTKKKSQFLKDDYDETDRECFIGEMCACLCCVGECALQSSFDKRLQFKSEKYCNKHYDFNSAAFYKKSYKMLESLRDNTYPEKEDVMELLRDVDEEVRALDKKVYRDIKNMEVKIAVAQRSIV